MFSYDSRCIFVIENVERFPLKFRGATANGGPRPTRRLVVSDSHMSYDMEVNHHPPSEDYLESLWNESETESIIKQKSRKKFWNMKTVLIR